MSKPFLGLIIVCLTIYLSVFTDGCWKAVEKGTECCYESKAKVEEVKPAPKPSLEQLLFPNGSLILPQTFEKKKEQPKELFDENIKTAKL
jgi:hypothetical protein